MPILWWRAGHAPNVSADLGDVLLDELNAVRQRRDILAGGTAGIAVSVPPVPSPRPLSSKLDEYHREAHELGNLSALCLSGGGIRSAAFALGVIQGLASRGLLARFDYLSTVSGGGYIGAFLTAWVQRHGYDAVVRELTGGPASAVRFSPLRHLRRYSNYLTPRTGILSTDMLTVIALYTRNLLLNWLVLIPLLLVALLLVKLLTAAAWRVPANPEMIGMFGAAAIGLIGVAMVDSLQQRPGWVDESSHWKRFLWFEMLPLLLAGIFASVATLKYYESPAMAESPLNPLCGVALIGAALFFVCVVVALAFSEPPRTISTTGTIRSIPAPRAACVIVVFVMTGALAGLTLAAVTDFVLGFREAYPRLTPFLMICLGPPMMIVAFFAGDLVYTALTSYVRWGDAEREWLARAAGYHGRAAVTWAATFLAVFGGSYVLFRLYDERAWTKLTTIGSVGGLAGLITTLVGKASSTAATLKRGYDSLQNRSAGFVLAIAMPVFVLVAVSFLSAAIDLFANGAWLWFWNDRELNPAFWERLVALLAGAGLVGAVASLAINTNRFSLHGLYRNRLIRAFLGASNDRRRANAFIDFDQNDNIDLSDLWPNRRPANQIPPHFLVTNMALNIVATRELAWQERKALSFTATPRWIGCGDLKERGFYRRAEEYGGRMSLGTAITVSGAAASPNMGYHSSPGPSVLMTFFNVRLGAWLGNPGPAGDRSYCREGPRFAAGPLVQEALGLTNDEKRYVYLSDGGHFDNLGLYEMVRRRCHIIVVTDAGSDPACGFEDLGNAVRRISIDLNVAINFRALKILARKNPPVEGPYCAVADIVYPDRRAAPGLLLYVKPGYQGVEPASVRSYAEKSSVFPHESTADQWFGESQFEAYRALGQYIIDTLDRGAARPPGDIREFIGAVATRLMRAPLRPR